MVADFSKIGRSNVNRGKSYERKIAKLLTEWSGTKFRRRRVEGRDSTTIDRDSTSDVIPIGKDSYYSIEAKCGKDFSFDGLLAEPTKCKFSKWWFQANYDAKLLSDHRKIDYYPMLFFKPHVGVDWVVIPEIKVHDLLRLDHYNGIVYRYVGVGEFEMDVSHSKKNPKMVSMQLCDAVFLRWDYFAKHCLPHNFFRPPPSLT